MRKIAWKDGILPGFSRPGFCCRQAAAWQLMWEQLLKHAAVARMGMKKQKQGMAAPAFEEEEIS